MVGQTFLAHVKELELDFPFSFSTGGGEQGVVVNVVSCGMCV